MNIGENIKKLRAARGLTQKELAEQLGFTSQNISKWENGSSMPDIPTVVTIAQFFNISLDVLLENEPKLDVLKQEVNCFNTAGTFSVWTDFEYNGSAAPDAILNPGRHRTGAEKVNRYYCPSFENCIALAVNANDKICNIYVLNPQRNQNRLEVYFYSTGYYRPDEKNACVVPNSDAGDNWVKNGECEVLLPKGGYILTASANDIRMREILDFIIPEEHHKYFNSSMPMYNDFYCNIDGKRLLCDVLAHGELDKIKVSLEGNNIIFEKPTEYINPLYDNIDKLTQLVKSRVELELRSITESLAMLDSRCDDLESSIDDVESRVDELEE